jgi:hypothetical protein
MSTYRNGLLATFTMAGLGLGVLSASADTYTPINLSPYVDSSYNSLINPSQYPTGTGITGNQGSPVPFDIANVGVPGTPTFLNYWGGTPGGQGDFGNTLAITGRSINSNTAYTLINSTFGTAGDNPIDVTFKGTLGTREFDLFEGVNMRDYNDGIYVNTAPATMLWYDNGGAQNGSGADQHFDMQTYDLTGLGTITEVDFMETVIVAGIDPNGGVIPGPDFGGENSILSGLSFLNAAQTTGGGGGVPEPITLSIFGAGLAGAGVIRRRMKRKA